ncbi:DUF4253 domain-containing protein [Dactylosporangium sp. NBC_01737]|uniref:DUF4253 domain-containing protein n=1 Tax=Dactylosporangium sp. NBC_01737 TaxID=2975959 RepID=UPI002E11842F|nr:DUF4253 domain-containing protein [Dactylosporangium sp. NBC_01737]
MFAKRLTLPGRVKALTVPLPAGKHIRPDLDDDEPAVLWLSKTAPPPGLWEQLRAAHPTSGLWPLLLTPLDGDAARPWVEGELVPDDMSDPAEHDPAHLLSSWWSQTATGNAAWPGLAPATTTDGADVAKADATADREAAALLASRRPWRLGLVAAGRGADAPTVAGWDGPANHTDDTAHISAVLRSWEDRFGARVVGLGFAELFLSVAAPPATADDALRVAAEHFAFCPDNVSEQPLAEYAAGLVGMPAWHFWWD